MILIYVCLVVAQLTVSSSRTITDEADKQSQGQYTHFLLPHPNFDEKNDEIKVKVIPYPTYIEKRKNQNLNQLPEGSVAPKEDLPVALIFTEPNKKRKLVKDRKLVKNNNLDEKIHITPTQILPSESLKSPHDLTNDDTDKAADSLSRSHFIIHVTANNHNTVKRNEFDFDTEDLSNEKRKNHGYVNWKKNIAESDEVGPFGKFYKNTKNKNQLYSRHYFKKNKSRQLNGDSNYQKPVSKQKDENDQIYQLDGHFGKEKPSDEKIAGSSNHLSQEADSVHKQDNEHVIHYNQDEHNKHFTSESDSSKSKEKANKIFTEDASSHPGEISFETIQYDKTNGLQNIDLKDISEEAKKELSQQHEHSKENDRDVETEVKHKHHSDENSDNHHHNEEYSDEHDFEQNIHDDDENHLLNTNLHVTGQNHEHHVNEHETDGKHYKEEKQNLEEYFGHHDIPNNQDKVKSTSDSVKESSNEKFEHKLENHINYVQLNPNPSSEVDESHSIKKTEEHPVIYEERKSSKEVDQDKSLQDLANIIRVLTNNHDHKKTQDLHHENDNSDGEVDSKYLEKNLDKPNENNDHKHQNYDPNSLDDQIFYGDVNKSGDNDVSYLADSETGLRDDSLAVYSREHSKENGPKKSVEVQGEAVIEIEHNSKNISDTAEQDISREISDSVNDHNVSDDLNPKQSESNDVYNKQEGNLNNVHSNQVALIINNSKRRHNSGYNEIPKYRLKHSFKSHPKFDNLDIALSSLEDNEDESGYTGDLEEAHKKRKQKNKKSFFGKPNSHHKDNNDDVSSGCDDSYESELNNFKCSSSECAAHDNYSKEKHHKRKHHHHHLKNKDDDDNPKKNDSSEEQPRQIRTKKKSASKKLHHSIKRTLRHPEKAKQQQEYHVIRRLLKNRELVKNSVNCQKSTNSRNFESSINSNELKQEEKMLKTYNLSFTFSRK